MHSHAERSKTYLAAIKRAVAALWTEHERNARETSWIATVDDLDHIHQVLVYFREDEPNAYEGYREIVGTFLQCRYVEVADVLIRALLLEIDDLRDFKRFFDGIYAEIERQRDREEGEFIEAIATEI